MEGNDKNRERFSVDESVDSISMMEKAPFTAGHGFMQPGEPDFMFNSLNMSFFLF
jgi:hypothetical protein